MSGSRTKEIRTQLRHIFKEEASQLLTEALFAQLNTGMNARLDNIEKFCQEKLKEQNDRARAIQGWIIQEVSVKLAGALDDMLLTNMAYRELLEKHYGAIADFDRQLEERKTEIKARLQKEAEERMAKALQQQEEAKAPAPAAEETPASEPESQSA